MSFGSNANPPRPDKESNREGWNASWEQELRFTYDVSQLNHTAPPPSEKLRKLTSIEAPQLFLIRAFREICELQKDLATLAVQKLVVDDFEGQWKALAHAHKERIVLEAFYQTSCAGLDMENRRKWCPEMTLKYLTEKQGANVIHLLKQHTPENLEDISEPIYVGHPGFDKLLEDEGYSLMAPTLRMGRCYYITMVLWRILLAFYGGNERYIVGRLPREKQVDEAIKSIMGKDEARRMDKDYGQTHRDTVNVCWNCGLDASRLEGRQLRACSACRAIGRGIRYCSPECQKQDWKHGKPTPHKSICGKKGANEPREIQSKPQDDGDQRIPRADPAFKRSANLLHQISFLNKPPYVDYVVMQPYPADDIGISFHSPFLRERFLIMRQRALKTGDPGCVYTMLILLGCMVYALGYPISIEHIHTQLSREYNLNLDRDVETSGWEVSMPTDAEKVAIQRLILSSEHGSTPDGM